jgi:anti-anti-sigma factor
MRHRVLHAAALSKAESGNMPVDATSADELEAALRALTSRLDAEAAPGEAIILDFSDIDYINSSHLAQLLRVRKKLTDRGARLMLCGMSDQLWSTVHLTGLDRVFKVAATVRDAQGILSIEERA